MQGNYMKSRKILQMTLPRPPGSKKLVNSKEQTWRIRVGDYRILYTIEDQIKIVDIRKVGHRKDVYQ